MSVNLQKGQKISLKKSDGKKLSRLMVGLGWDAVDKSEHENKSFFGRLFSSSIPQDIDCDATVFVCQDGKLVSNEDVVYFGNLKHKSGAITHMGDNLTGEGDGDDEEIFIDLERLPNKYNRIIFVVNIYKAVERRQHFGMIKNAFIRIIDPDSREELCRFNLSENYSEMLSMIAGEVYLRNDEWKFNAIGSGTKDKSISELSRRFK